MSVEIFSYSFQFSERSCRLSHHHWGIWRRQQFVPFFTRHTNKEENIPHIQGDNTSDPFIIDIKAIRRWIRAIGRNKSVWPDRIPGEILKMGGEVMIPYLARLLEITMNNGALSGDWRRTTVVPVHKGGDRPLVTNYRPVSLTSVVCKQMEHAIAL